MARGCADLSCCSQSVCAMTGLDVEKDQIIEMACLITDSNLNILAEGPNVIIKQPDELLEGMSEWCKEHHGKVSWRLFRGSYQ
uniref:Exonuclease domain-containing protein n=1 Tax=Haplochromis burtoni TaxID=8153 RepID=A0A3Q3CTW6_HAPBU